jgi:hypothetical protein
VKGASQPAAPAEALPQLSLAQIHAALAYYYEAPAEIEAELRVEDELVVRMAGQYAPHMDVLT